MTRTRTAGALLATLIAVTGLVGCSKRQIDADATDSVKIPGTSWYRMCDGRNAIFWVEGASGDADEIEMVIYEHWACIPAGEDATSENNGPAADPDGIAGEDED